MVLLMRGLTAAYLLSALLATATPIRRVSSLNVGDAHEPEIVNLFPRGPPKRTGPALASDHAKQQKPDLTVQQPNALSETPNSDRQSEFEQAKSMVNGIRRQCLAIVGTPGKDKRKTLEQSLVKSIYDLVRAMPNLLQGKDEIAVEAKTLLIQGFIFASKSVAWGSSVKEMDAALNSWQQNILPSYPKRPPEDINVSYITSELEYIKERINREHLEESLHTLMSACLSILALDMKKLLFRDIKKLFPDIQPLSLNIDKGTLDVAKMSPELEELGKMLSLAFKVLWTAKEKVAGWKSSPAKAESKSAIVALEFALKDVSNDQQVDSEELQRRLDDLEIEEPGPVVNLRVHEFVRGLLQLKIVDQRKMQKELGVAYEKVMTKIRNNFNVEKEETDKALRRWEALDTLV